MDKFIEKVAMESIKGNWSHLFVNGNIPQKPYPTGFETELKSKILELHQLKPHLEVALKEFHKDVRHDLTSTVTEIISNYAVQYTFPEAADRMLNEITGSIINHRFKQK